MATFDWLKVSKLLIGSTVSILNVCILNGSKKITNRDISINKFIRKGKVIGFKSYSIPSVWVLASAKMRSCQNIILYTNLYKSYFEFSLPLTESELLKISPSLPSSPVVNHRSSRVSAMKF